jgi:NADPH:quinone reductase-like Zn-dependent oxidoreductase
MKAIAHERYGSFELLELRDIPKPEVGDDDVRVRVRAAGLHVGDCFSVRGAPFAMRFATGLLKPKHGVPGFDVAGQIEAVGKNVTRFRAGDEVFGACNGACAEFVRIKPDQLAHKPAKLGFEQAAALPTSGLAALHALRDVGKVRRGQRVLINGASGGVGTLAVQIAKSFGAEVTGVCSTQSLELVRSLGADHAVDYSREDFTLGEQRYDLIFDNVENRTLSELRRVLVPKGMLILNSGTGARGMKLMVRLIKPLVLSPFASQDLRRYLSVPNHEDLAVLGELVEAGRLHPVIDRIYPLDQTAAALAYIERGHARGKVIIHV